MGVLQHGVRPGSDHLKLCTLKSNSEATNKMVTEQGNYQRLVVVLIYKLEKIIKADMVLPVIIVQFQFKKGTPKPSPNQETGKQSQRTQKVQGSG